LALMEDLTAYARVLGENAREASRQVRGLPRAKRDAVLKAVAAALVARQEEILGENARDMEESKERGLSAAMLDRLMLNPARIQNAPRILKKRKHSRVRTTTSTRAMH